MDCQNTRTITELVGALEKHLAELNYHSSTIARLHSVWRSLMIYCDEKQVTEINAALCREFVVVRYGVVLGEKEKAHNVQRAIHMLLDFQQFGVVFKQSHTSKKQFSPAYQEVFEGFLKWYQKNGIGENSIRTWRSRLFRFEYFLHKEEIEHFEDLQLEHLNRYLQSLVGFSSTTISSTITILGRLSRYALEHGYHSRNFSVMLPSIRLKKQSRLPTVFTPLEVDRILSTVDRSTALGKRNYAILILVAKSGVRISDVCALQFDSIHWNDKEISFVQQKTGVPVNLPLLDDVGWAMIDYLKNGRPASNSAYVFIKHLAPYDALSSSLHKIVVNALRRAKIKVSVHKMIGMHSFRHSLATTMLENGAQITEIAHVLGHSTPHSTERYISLNLDMLRRCALEVDL